MGIGFPSLEYLIEKRLIGRGNRILDIGFQNLLYITPENVVSFLRRFGRPISHADLKEASERLAYFSVPRPDRTDRPPLHGLRHLTGAGHRDF
jgi:hypothetical protein